jgi:hypothetical protein
VIRKRPEAVKDNADVIGRFAEIGTVGHKKKRIVQLDDEMEMGETEGKDETHDLSPKPAMVKEQFWQE